MNIRQKHQLKKFAIDYSVALTVGAIICPIVFRYILRIDIEMTEYFFIVPILAVFALLLKYFWS